MPRLSSIAQFNATIVSIDCTPQTQNVITYVRNANHECYLAAKGSCNTCLAYICKRQGTLHVIQRASTRYSHIQEFNDHRKLASRYFAKEYLLLQSKLLTDLELEAPANQALRQIPIDLDSLRAPPTLPQPRIQYLPCNLQHYESQPVPPAPCTRKHLDNHKCPIVPKPQPCTRPHLPDNDLGPEHIFSPPSHSLPSMFSVLERTRNFVYTLESTKSSADLDLPFSIGSDANSLHSDYNDQRRTNTPHSSKHMSSNQPRSPSPTPQFTTPREYPDPLTHQTNMFDLLSHSNLEQRTPNPYFNSSDADINEPAHIFDSYSNKESTLDDSDTDPEAPIGVMTKSQHRSVLAQQAANAFPNDPITIPMRKSERKKLMLNAKHANRSASSSQPTQRIVPNQPSSAANAFAMQYTQHLPPTQPEPEKPAFFRPDMPARSPLKSIFSHAAELSSAPVPTNRFRSPFAPTVEYTTNTSPT